MNDCPIIEEFCQSQALFLHAKIANEFYICRKMTYIDRYVVGFCYLRQALRSFRLDRIEALKLQVGRFKRPADFDIQYSWRLMRVCPLSLLRPQGARGAQHWQGQIRCMPFMY